MRAFLALDIPEDTAAALTRLQSALPFGRPVPEDNLHLTLAFLEAAPVAALEDLHELLSALRAAPVEVRFTELDSFTETERGLVFAAVERTDALQALHGNPESPGLWPLRPAFAPCRRFARAFPPPIVTLGCAGQTAADPSGPRPHDRPDGPTNLGAAPPTWAGVPTAAKGPMTVIPIHPLFVEKAADPLTRLRGFYPLRG